MDIEARAAELLESGWSEAEVRDFRRGAESAPVGHSASLPAAPEPQRQAWMAPDQLRPLPRGDRGVWFRTTNAGKLKAVVSPDDPAWEADELKRARDWADDYEYRYNRRPTPLQARYAVRTDRGGVWLSGTADEIGRVFQQAGLKFAVVTEHAPLPDDASGITQQPTVPG